MSSEAKKKACRPVFSIGVFAIIFDKNDKILLCHRKDYDLWNLPGGELEENESPWQGVVREVKEETNLDVVINTLLGVYHKPEQNEVVFSFLCSVVGGYIKLTDESDDIKFFSFSRIPSNISIKQRERIIDAYKNQNYPLLKIQKGSDYIEVIKKTGT